jgi:C1A family cysteine protease
MEGRKFGWKKDPKDDGRDKKYAVRKHTVAAFELPIKTNNIATAPPVVDQLQTSSCVGNSVAVHLQHTAIIQGDIDAELPSRMFIWFTTRLMEGTSKLDEGCCIRNSFKVAAHLGAPHESTWPFDPEKFAKCPTLSAYREARKHQAIEYYSIDWTNLNEVKTCLAGGHGFVFGFQVPESFGSVTTTKTGIMQMPEKGEVFEGGHAVYAVDYDDEVQHRGWAQPGGILVQNSWGEHWGFYGRFWMPYAYVTDPDLSDDFWTARKVET